MECTAADEAAREAFVAADDRIRVAFVRIGEAQQRQRGAQRIFYGGVPAEGAVAATAKLAAELEAVVARLEAEEWDQPMLERQATQRLAQFEFVKTETGARIARKKGEVDELLILSKTAAGKVFAHALDDRYQALAELVTRAGLSFDELPAAAGEAAK